MPTLQRAFLTTTRRLDTKGKSDADTTLKTLHFDRLSSKTSTTLSYNH